MEGKCSCYRGGQFIGRRMVMLQRWSVKWRENSHLTEVASLMEGEWSCCRGGHTFSENGHVTEMDRLMEGERLFTEVVS